MNIDKYMPVSDILQFHEYEKRYKIICQDGYGYMTAIDIFDGIQVIINDFHCSSCPENTFSHEHHFLEINHCLHGRFESSFEDNRYGYLGEGDLAINDWSIHRLAAGFPLNYYYGIEVLIDVETASQLTFLTQLNIDVMLLFKKLKQNHKLFFMRSTEQIQHIILEMYDVPQNIRINYLKIKVAELLLFLQNTPFETLCETKKYYTRQQIECVKHIKEHLQQNISKKCNIPQLAQEHHININTLRKCFKEIYGKPIYQWHKEYRLQISKELLKNTDLSIIEIASKVGYDNPSKFSAAFFQLFQENPLSYRKHHQ